MSTKEIQVQHTKKDFIKKKNLYIIRRWSLSIFKFSGLDSQKGEVNKTTMQNTKI